MEATASQNLVPLLTSRGTTMATSAELNGEQKEMELLLSILFYLSLIQMGLSPLMYLSTMAVVLAAGINGHLVKSSLL